MSWTLTRRTDYRNAPDRVGVQVAGARHVCVSCHAARTDAPDPVGHRVRPWGASATPGRPLGRGRVTRAPIRSPSPRFRSVSARRG